MNTDFIYVEKYRPSSIDECILPTRIKNIFKTFKNNKNFPNLMLCGTAGTGKTSVARALLNDLDFEYIFLNASKERGIDTIRTVLTDFCSTVSLEDKRKAVILDEADGLTQDAQNSLRSFIEEYDTVRFILTCNYSNKLSEAIHSRTTKIEFNYDVAEQTLTRKLMFDRVIDILDKENVKYNKASVAQLVSTYFPDNRKILNELQKLSTVGILPETLSLNTDITNLLDILYNKDYIKCQEWVYSNSDIQFPHLINLLYREIKKRTDKNLPQIIITLADYDYKNNFVSNKEINSIAMLYSIMKQL